MKSGDSESRTNAGVKLLLSGGKIFVVAIVRPMPEREAHAVIAGSAHRKDFAFEESRVVGLPVPIVFDTVNA